MSRKYSYIKQPNLSITADDGTVYAYRELGDKKGIPVVFLLTCQRILITGTHALWMAWLRKNF